MSKESIEAYVREYERMKAKQDKSGKFGHLHCPAPWDDENDDADDDGGSK